MTNLELVNCQKIRTIWTEHVLSNIAMKIDFPRSCCAHRLEQNRCARIFLVVVMNRDCSGTASQATPEGLRCTGIQFYAYATCEGICLICGIRNNDSQLCASFRVTEGWLRARE